MAGVDALPGAGARSRVFPVLRLVLLGLWVAWALTAWWTAPRTATIDQARADAAAGRVVAFEFASSFDDADTVSIWFTPVEVTSTSQMADSVLVWRTGFGRVHYTQVTSIDPSGTGGWTEFEMLLPSFPANAEGTSIPPLAPVLATIIALISLLILVWGPAPGLGTRWFWFWLGGIPFGLGVLLWLRAERPWAEPEPPAPDRKTGQPKRYDGLTGLLLMILCGIVLSLLVALLRAFPEWLVPSALP
ncbi:hypothetical protein DFJ67_1131 [Asanoa ferruginea]|uniref:Uncharacterized protein n=1 Tax=Asanoa ferruginea TaxID=53367 RepID=A0A3D9ZE83_9ACTN|nr:hypothetical protein [Asanoa ferruginea]REF95179.1 hypothetical protein DFJ67_1131 [Asanoa ferruginea]GIF53405.1 hypothetical protein Afe04nite_79440 [Asanoa ferruginea]